MAKQNKLPATSEAVDKAFGVLDEALRATGRMLADDEESVRRSEEHIDLDSIELPESLRDPMEMLERGRLVLEHGFSAGHQLASCGASRGHLADAARSGQTISDELRGRMHKDRQAARSKRKKA